MKRTLTLLLIVLMLMGVLAGCTPPAGNNPDDGKTPPDNGKPTDNVDNNVTYNADFKIAGADADKLVDALKTAGVTLGNESAVKTIYIGNADVALAETAKAGANKREANYNDYAIVCNGTDLAIYGASSYATEQAITYLLATYQKEGAITVPKDLNYIAQPELANILVGNCAIFDMTIVIPDASCLGIANEMAKSIRILTGREIAVSSDPARRAINLVAQNTKNENDFKATYTVTAKENELTITAPTRGALAYATQDFVASLKNEHHFEAGYKADLDCQMVHTNATDTSLFKYCGTWQATDKENTTTMVSYWNAAYVEINFTGNAITAEFSRNTTFKMKMDNAETYSPEYNVTGEITFFAEGDGPHTLRIYANNRNAHMYFAGVSVPACTTLSRTPNRPHYIQFVGDSISDSTKSFSHRVGDVLGWDFSVTALSGIALERDWGYWRNNNGQNNGILTPGSMAELIKRNFGIDNIGMEDAFFKLGIAQEYMTGEERDLYANYYFSPELDYKFEAGYTPDIVFIFLGTNDALTKESDLDRFYTSYKNLVDNIFDVYGADTQICLLQALTHSSMPNNENHARYKVIRTAANKLIDLYPYNVAFIDRDQITQWNVEISSDTTHPTVNGYDTLTKEIAAVLQEYYKEES